MNMDTCKLSVVVRPHVSRLDLGVIEIHEDGVFVGEQVFLLHNARFPHHQAALFGEVSYTLFGRQGGILPTVEEVKPTFALLSKRRE